MEGVSLRSTWRTVTQVSADGDWQWQQERTVMTAEKTERKSEAHEWCSLDLCDCSSAIPVGDEWLSMGQKLRAPVLFFLSFWFRYSARSSWLFFTFLVFFFFPKQADVCLRRTWTVSFNRCTRMTGRSKCCVEMKRWNNPGWISDLCDTGSLDLANGNGDIFSADKCLTNKLLKRRSASSVGYFSFGSTFKLCVGKAGWRSFSLKS